VVLLAMMWTLVTRVQFLGLAIYMISGGGSSTRRAAEMCGRLAQTGTQITFVMKLDCVAGIAGVVLRSVASMVAGSKVEEMAHFVG